VQSLQCSLTYLACRSRYKDSLPFHRARSGRFITNELRLARVRPSMTKLPGGIIIDCMHNEWRKLLARGGFSGRKLCFTAYVDRRFEDSMAIGWLIDFLSRTFSTEGLRFCAMPRQTCASKPGGLHCKPAGLRLPIILRMAFPGAVERDPGPHLG
jgi:hypothetical protein